METGILAAVGEKRTNNDVDVEVIQRLLNRVSPAQGGASPRLAEDGDCGPKTIAAIRKFQQTALGFQDGAVDPFKATHRKLIDIAGSGEDIPIRIDLAERFVPRVEPMVARASNLLNVLRQNPAAQGADADRTREALKVHFLLDDPQDFQAGRVMSRMDTIRIDLPARELFWSEATFKQGKIELNETKTV
jgi:peptidoglycan hydrolase-like protein with peptidoglycan-binding domain